MGPVEISWIGFVGGWSQKNRVSFPQKGGECGKKRKLLQHLMEFVSFCMVCKSKNIVDILTYYFHCHGNHLMLYVTRKPRKSKTSVGVDLSSDSCTNSSWRL